MTNLELSNTLAHGWKPCPFIHNVEKVSGPKRSIKITYHFTCTSATVIYCITCTYCNKLYIGETGRRLGDWFREHLCDLERNGKDASKLVARHFIIIIIIFFICLIYIIQKHLFTAGIARRRGDPGSHRAYGRATSLTLINKVEKKCCECAARPIQGLFK